MLALHWSTIYLFLRKRKRLKRKTWRLSKINKTVIAQRYLAGESTTILARTFNISRSATRAILMARGINCRPRRRFVKTRSWDDAAFASLTPESAYWIGFLMADGYISPQGKRRKIIQLILAKKDTNQIVAFQRFLKSTHKRIKNTDGKGHLRVGVQITSRQLHRDLWSRGCVYGSQNRIPVPALTRSKDFWCGVIDGDGSLFITRNNEPRISLCGYKPLLEKFVEFLQFHNFKAYPLNRHGKIWTVNVSGKPSGKLAKLLYDRDGPSLARKKRVAKRIIRRCFAKI